MSNVNLFGELYERRMIKTWLRDRPEGWRLASGAWSPFYFMFRHVPSFPHLFHHCIEALHGQLERVRANGKVDCLIGLASTGIPLGAALAHECRIPFAFNRKVPGARSTQDLAKAQSDWGDHSMIEGVFTDGMSYVLVDDVVTGGASKELIRAQIDLEAQKRGIQLNFMGTIVVVDRGFPGHDNSKHHVFAAYRLYDSLRDVLSYGASERELAIMRRYLENPSEFQAQDAISRLSEEAMQPKR